MAGVVSAVRSAMRFRPAAFIVRFRAPSGAAVALVDRDAEPLPESGDLSFSSLPLEFETLEGGVQDCGIKGWLSGHGAQEHSAEN